MAQMNESMDEGLKKLLRQISDLMILPDADLEFLTSLQMNITNYTRQKSSALAAAQTGVGGPSAISDVAPGMGGPPGGQPMGGPPGAGGPPGGGMMGLSPGPAAADDLRRLLSAGSRGG